MLLSGTAVNTLADLFYSFEQQARPDLLMERRGSRFESIGAVEFGDRVRRCAAALGGLGVGRGDRVGLICSNRPEWHLIDFACHLRGAILVPLFSTLPPAQVRYIFEDSGCKVVFAEGEEQLAKVAGVRADLPDLEHLVVVGEKGTGDGAGAAPRGAASAAGSVADGSAVGRSAVGGLGGNGPGADTDLTELIASSPQEAEFPGPDGAEALATIIYTSGTTGQPKGVMLTHANLISNIQGSRQVLSCRPVDTALSVLPLCHVFQRIVDYAFFSAGSRIAYGVPSDLADDYLLVRPTVVAGVPRLFERFRAAVLEQVAAGGSLGQRIFRWAEGVGRRRAEHELAGGAWGWSDRLRFVLADRLVLRRVRAGAGGRIHYLVSGGAALDPSLNWWFESMGLRLIQGYGLTETSPVIAANSHAANRVGTVGKPIPGVEVKIAPDGEILTRGPHVMKGYWRREGATAEMIIDGWLHTGDIGAFEDGYLRITDRKKHILVMSTGKNVAPQLIENAITQGRYIEQVAAVGDGQPFVGALVVPDFRTLRPWAKERGKALDPESLCSDADVVALVRAEIDSLQADFARFERVRDFRLLPVPFSVDDGTLTPTLKAIRTRVEDKYAGLIAEIYREAVS